MIVPNPNDKDRYGANSAENFIDDYMLRHNIRIPPEVRLFLIDKLIKEEEKLLQPIIKEIKDNNLTDEPIDVFRNKIERRKTEFEQQDMDAPKFKTNTQDDRDIMSIHDEKVKHIKIKDTE